MKKIFLRIKNLLAKPEMLVLPGHLAFSILLGIVPMFTLITYIASFFHLSLDFITQFLSKAFTSDIANMFVPMVTNNENLMQMIITIGIGFYVASKGISAIIVTSNSIYHIEHDSSLKRIIKSILMMIILVVLVLFILIAPLGGNKIIELITYVNMNESITTILVAVINLIKGPISWFVIFFIIKIIYTMAPDRHIPSSYTTKGAIFTTFGFIVATFVYSLYINNVGSNTLLYGGLSHFVTLMIWLYILAYIFTIGIAINSQDELEKTGTIRINNEELEKTGTINLEN